MNAVVLSFFTFYTVYNLIFYFSRPTIKIVILLIILRLNSQSLMDWYWDMDQSLSGTA